MEMDKHTGLVLEGGGMRGVFTCGVLDWLLDHHIDFSLHGRCVGRGVQWLVLYEPSARTGEVQQYRHAQKIQIHRYAFFVDAA